LYKLEVPGISYRRPDRVNLGAADFRQTADSRQSMLESVAIVDADGNRVLGKAFEVAEGGAIVSHMLCPPTQPGFLSGDEPRLGVVQESLLGILF